MSFRKKTIKFGQTYGTPTAPTTPTPKTPSPKAPKIIRTVTAPTVTTAPKAVTKPTTQRGAIPTTPAGVIAQEKFKAIVQSVTHSIKQQISELEKQASAFHTEHPYLDTIEGEIKKLEQELTVIEQEPITEIIEEPVIEPITEIIEEPIIELPELLPEVSAEPDSSITDNMVTQQLINFNIVNGRAVGSIKFTATNNFNPFWYGKNISNIVQFKDPNGANILTTVKENRLNFTETERDEVINFDEDMQGNTRATVESFVWSSATAPTPFSKMYSIEISEAEPPKPLTTGFMGAGIAGAIAGLVLIGFIADHKRGK